MTKLSDNKKLHDFWQRMDLPVHVTEHFSQLTVSGFCKVEIDLADGLLGYSENEICVGVPGGSVCVEGADLRISLMREGRIVLCGEIEQVSFLRGMRP